MSMWNGCRISMKRMLLQKGSILENFHISREKGL